MKRRLQLLGIWVLCLFGAAATLLIMLGKVFTNPDKAFNIAVAFDRAGNVAANGDRDETISSRAYRDSLEGRVWGCIFCKVLDKLDKDHCKKSAGV